MMTPDEQADALSRWLATPGTPLQGGDAPHPQPPEGLDPDVVEAVYALRPDLAPAPSIDLDALLDSVGAGPLASPERPVRDGPGAEVVAFPGRPAVVESEPSAKPAAAPWRRWVALAGGTSSLGLLAAAALVLVFVALPVGSEIQRANEPVAASPAAQSRAPAAEPSELEAPSAPSVPLPSPVPTARAAGRSAPVAAAAEPPPPPPPPPGQAGPATEGVVSSEIRADAYYRENSVIPEIAEAPTPTAAPPGLVAGVPAVTNYDAEPIDAVADLEEDLDQSGLELSKSERKEDRDLERVEREQQTAAPARPAAAAPAKDERSEAWRRGLDPGAAQALDTALSEADAIRRAGDPAGAAARLDPLIRPPARAGQYVALLAARDWLAAGDVARAEAAAEEGLALSSAGSPERNALQRVLDEIRGARAEPQQERSMQPAASDGR